MYNRYIPQPDGTFRRNSVPDRAVPKAPPPRREPETPCPPPPPSRPERCPRREPSSRPGGSISGFLKNLLPKDFDTSDLLIVLLLLIMAGDCQEDQNTALLTLALYLFM